jgi:multidrug efflux pump subunit AcrB
LREPGANIIETVDRIKAALPSLKASIPSGINMTVVLDRTTTIRASVREIERTLLISVALVILVVFIFLRSPRATMIPAVVVPVSLIATFGVMYLFGYSVDNLSLMALTISTGFVVDDAIVVIENVSRHLEKGMSAMQAALIGAREVGFTVLSISISLVVVFIPILLMGGIVGRLFREFAVVLSTAILVSLVVSLTATPMMCSRLLRHRRPDEHGKIYRASETVFTKLLGADDFAAHDCPEHLSVRHRAERIFPAAGQRHSSRRRARRAGHFVSRDASGDATVCPHHHQRPGGSKRHRLHRRPGRGQQRVYFHGAQAARRTQNFGGPSHRQIAAQTRGGAGRFPVFAGRTGLAHRRPHEQRAVSIHDPK